MIVGEIEGERRRDEGREMKEERDWERALAEHAVRQLFDTADVARSNANGRLLALQICLCCRYESLLLNKSN